MQGAYRPGTADGAGERAGEGRGEGFLELGEGEGDARGEGDLLGEGERLRRATAPLETVADLRSSVAGERREDVWGEGELRTGEGEGDLGRGSDGDGEREAGDAAAGLCESSSSALCFPRSGEEVWPPGRAKPLPACASKGKPARRAQMRTRMAARRGELDMAAPWPVISR